MGSIVGAIRLVVPLEPGISSFSETIQGWSDGLTPAQLEDMAALGPGNSFHARYQALWSLQLEDLARRCDPGAFAVWAADLPAALREALVRHALDDLATLYILRRYPDFENWLTWPFLLRGMIAHWRLLMHHDGPAAASEFLHSLRFRPLREYFFVADDKERSTRYGRLLLNFLASFPGRYPDRHGLLQGFLISRLAVFLPHFFNSRRRFRERLQTLRAFTLTSHYTDVVPMHLVPLFQRVLKRGEKVRPNNLILLLQRLETLYAYLKKPGLAGLLQQAPSVRFLEKHLRRLERRLRHLPPGSQLEESVMVEFPAAPLPVWPGMAPLRNVECLVAEGRYMRNCIASYEPELRAGEKAAFAVAWPERCTVLVERIGSRWAIEDARAWQDAFPTQATLTHLARWIRGELPPAELLAAPQPFEYFTPRTGYDACGFMPYWLVHPEALVTLPSFHERAADDFAMEGGDDAIWVEFEMPIIERDPAPQLHLPEKLGRWRRVDSLEILENGGIPEALVPAIGSRLHPAHVVLYVHEAMASCFAIIPVCEEPAHALYFEHADKTGSRSWSQLDLQRMQCLRDAIAELTLPQ